jgi:RimJ/RimL family protein N-acetyltransferase
MILTTPRLLLRPFEEGDAADVFAYARDPGVGPAAGWMPHQSEAESLTVIRTIYLPQGAFALTLRDEGRALGSVGFVGRRHVGPAPNDEIGYALHPAYWGRGLMAEAVFAVMEYGFTELSLQSIWCVHDEGNERSRRVIKACGFRRRFSAWSASPFLGQRRLEHHYALGREEWVRGRLSGSL